MYDSSPRITYILSCWAGETIVLPKNPSAVQFIPKTYVSSPKTVDILWEWTLTWDFRNPYFRFFSRLFHIWSSSLKCESLIPWMCTIWTVERVIAAFRTLVLMAPRTCKLITPDLLTYWNACIDSRGSGPQMFRDTMCWF